jgi:hypothetical protein
MYPYLQGKPGYRWIQYVAVPVRQTRIQEDTACIRTFKVNQDTGGYNMYPYFYGKPGYRRIYHVSVLSR